MLKNLLELILMLVFAISILPFIIILLLLIYLLKGFEVIWKNTFQQNSLEK